MTTRFYTRRRQFSQEQTGVPYIRGAKPGRIERLFCLRSGGLALEICFFT